MTTDPGPITTEAEYQAALAQVAHGFGSPSSTPEENWLDSLMDRITAYEASFGPVGPPDPSLSEEDLERLWTDITDVAGWLLCRHPGLVEGIVVYRHRGRPVSEIASVVTRHAATANWRTLLAEAEAALRALDYVVIQDWGHLSHAIRSLGAEELSQHRRLEGYTRIRLVLPSP